MNKIERKTLGELGEFFSGLSGKSKDDFKDGNAKFITYMNVYSNLALRTDVSDRVKVAVGEKQNTLEKGDVLFTGSSETPDECGMSSVVTVDVTEPLYLNSFCFGFRLNDKKLFNPDFLKHLLRSTNIRHQITRTASGVTRFNVSKVKMAKVSLPVPPLEVQSEIVQILDNFAKLTAELTAELAKRKKQYEHYRDTLFEGCDTLDTVESVLISLKTGLNPRQNFKLNTPKSTQPYVTGKDVFGNKINISDRTDLIEPEVVAIINRRACLESGDVLFASTGTGTVGRMALVENYQNDWAVSETMYCMKVKRERILPKFLMFALTSGFAKSQFEPKISKGSVPHLKVVDLLRVRLPLPPLAEQERIVGILDKFDKLVNSLTEGLPAEIAAREKQYAYYRDKLLSFGKGE